MQKEELFFEPRKNVLSIVSAYENEPEMTEYESAFLCGIIRKIRPQRILEIGVAAGGTTAIILNCLKQLGLESCRLDSIDICEAFYRDPERSTGFLAQEYKEKSNCKINHRMLLGKTLAEQFDSLDGKYDLVVLDTMHKLPGELLDAPLILSLLKEDAYLVIHDIQYQHYYGLYGISNNALFGGICGEKEYSLHADSDRPLTNIGAVVVDKNTKLSLDNLFFLLFLPWEYMPGESEFAEYRKKYCDLYGQKYADLFDAAIEQNRITMNAKKKPRKLSFFKRIKRCVRVMLRGY